MIIDLILDRKNKNWEYNVCDFYKECKQNVDIGYDITMAMDFGNEKDVKYALADYIIKQNYDIKIIDYINSVNWLV